MPLKKIMKILGMVVIAVILGIIIYITLLSIAFNEFTKELKESSVYGKDLIKTDEGDEFKIEYKTSSFPKYMTRVLIYNKSHKFHKDSYSFTDSINNYITREDYIRPKFRLFVDNEKVRAYEITVIKKDGSEERKLYIYRTPYSPYRRTRKDEIDFWIK